MLKVPEPIEDVVRRCERGERPRHTVRKLLQWFDVSRRGASSTAQIALVLQSKGLATNPDFSDAWIDEELEFSLAVQRVDAAATLMIASPDASPDESASLVAPPVEPVAVLERPGDGLTKAPSVAPPNDGVGGYRFGSLDLPSRHRPAFVLRTESLAVAISRMQIDGAAVMLVSNNGLRNIVGVLTWPMIVQALQERSVEHWTIGQCCERFGQSLESTLCSSEEELLEVARRVRRDGYVVVRQRNGEHFVVTLAELGTEFAQRLEPFLLATEIEAALRWIVHVRLPDEARALLSSRALSADDDREEGVRVTIGEAIYLLSNDRHWDKAQLGHDRRGFTGLLEEARVARNNVVHVNPEGVAEDHIHTLRRCVSVLRAVIKRLR